VKHIPWIICSMIGAAASAGLVCHLVGKHQYFLASGALLLGCVSLACIVTEAREVRNALR
jgi:hypothetical protein